ncbi:uncharacterized protein LOC124327680 [Daphnia pulicaria]|uniref:uncharacterized protein LOC124327680 n=1 Tax=Daphnia pulicaria TaxID=35523 RepID=UPI001EEAF1A1|nr:uncharacterized protein LOC124327680 [Daphnia pulicaria]
MFIKVRFREEDQAAFHYFWRRPGDSGPPVTYQMMVDMFGAASSPTSYATISCCHHLIELLKNGGFPLTQAMSSSRELWLSFPPKFRAKPALNIGLDELPVERTLGLIWQVESGTFTFLLNIENDADTKREIVSSVASIFDPKGFLACITVIPKKIIQDILRLGRKEEGGQSWYDELPSSITERWKTFPKN